MRSKALEKVTPGGARFRIGSPPVTPGSRAARDSAVPEYYGPTDPNGSSSARCTGTGSGYSGSFMFSDASLSTYFKATADNTFNVRATGGYPMYTNTALTSGLRGARETRSGFGISRQIRRARSYPFLPTGSSSKTRSEIAF